MKVYQMNRQTVFPTVLVAFMLVLVLVGCGGGSSPVTPNPGVTPDILDPGAPTGDTPAITAQTDFELKPRDNHIYMGAFDIVIDPETE